MIHAINRCRCGSCSVGDALERLIDAIDALNEAIGRVVSWLALGMVLVTVVVVVLRYAFDLGWIAMQESVTYLHATLFMLGAGYTLKHGGHVRVDIFYGRMGPRARAWVDLLGTLFLLLPVCGFILWISYEYVAESWSVMEGSREAGGIHGVFLLKSLIPLFCVLMILQGLAMAGRAWRVIRAGEAPDER